MKKLSFKKGWFPMDGLAFDGKLDFPREPVLEVFSPREILLPMLQHIGEPAEPIVKVGEKVTVGQMIGRSSGPLSVPVHTGISGTVTGIKQYELLNRKHCMAVEITNDHKRTLHTSIQRREKPERLTPSVISKLLDFSGIVGMGGEGYPTAKKCVRAYQEGVSTLIVNACQSEPYLSGDIHLLREQLDRVIRGAGALSGLCKVSNVVFCVMDKWLIELEALRDAFAHFQTVYPDRKFIVRVMRSRFPQGYERLLIKALYNVELPAGRRPENTVGAVVFNVSTCAAVADMVERNMPLVQRIISISGDTTQGHNMLVPICSYADEILARVPCAASANRIVMGCAITGACLTNAHVPIIKTTQGLALIRKSDPPKTPCVHCGACIDACPVGLQPYLCHRLLEVGDEKTVEELGVAQCISCGACSFVCPAGKDLAFTISRAGHRARRRGRS